eukprot:551831-Pelagomonas_calceolata.AAC.1
MDLLAGDGQVCAVYIPMHRWGKLQLVPSIGGREKLQLLAHKARDIGNAGHTSPPPPYLGSCLLPCLAPPCTPQRCRGYPFLARTLYCEH